MVYELILIIASLQGHQSVSVGVYETMSGCFESRETIVETVGRPVVNYQAICLIEDNSTISADDASRKEQYTF